MNNLPNSIEIIRLNETYNKPFQNTRKPLACDISNITFCVAKPKNNFIIFILNFYLKVLIWISKELKLIECSENYKYLDLLKKYKLENNLDFQIETFDVKNWFNANIHD